MRSGIKARVMRRNESCASQYSLVGGEHILALMYFIVLLGLSPLRLISYDEMKEVLNKAVSNVSKQVIGDVVFLKGTGLVQICARRHHISGSYVCS